MYNDTAIAGDDFNSRTYYWILARDKTSGKSVILGAYNDESEANRIGFEKLEGDFEVIPLNTKDASRATKILKYRRFNQTSKLEDVLRRAKHKI